MRRRWKPFRVHDPPRRCCLRPGFSSAGGPKRGLSADVYVQKGSAVSRKRRRRREKREDGEAVIRDCDSVNGTYLSIDDEYLLRDGDLILMGQNLIRFDLWE